MKGNKTAKWADHVEELDLETQQSCIVQWRLQDGNDRLALVLQPPVLLLGKSREKPQVAVYGGPSPMELGAS
jgi:hypothetical protein